MKKMPKGIWKVLFILLVIAIVIAYTYSKYTKEEKSNDYDYTNSIYVVTENALHDGNDYYEVNDERKYHRVSNFVPDKIEKYYFKECFTSNANIDVGKILNSFKEDTCKITDDKDNKVELNDTFRSIISVIVDKLYNPITDIIIYKDNNRYYTTVMFTLPTHDSYKFYYFDTDKKALKHIVTFNDKYVINIKEKETFIFDKGGN
ncbi:MAG: hypothetical protein IKI04_00275 [Bacilli bacterium]|nr:hypothetical protein [Bacilli bacterium]